MHDRLQQTLAASKRNELYCALMFIDLDNFKPLNDRHGHAVGDLLLVEVAKRISRCVRETDTVSRFGGDEFIVILSELSGDVTESSALAAAVAEKIRAVLSEPYVLQLREKPGSRSIDHLCSSSIGVALFTGQETSPEELLKQADIAMYRSKQAGRNIIRFHE
jgi:diguanylate cyclase (GGDEF)-like protein